MTCREKLKIEHPDMIRNDCWAGCIGCPHSYGYMPIPDNCPYTGNNTSLGLNEKLTLCIRCWNRDISEQESGTESEPTEPKPRISNMMDLLWFVEKVMANGDKMVSISFDMYPDNISANVYPYPLKKNEGENR